MTDRYSADICIYENLRLVQTIHTSLNPIHKAVSATDGRIFAITWGTSGVFELDKNGQVVDHFGGHSQLFAGPFGVAKGIAAWVTGNDRSVVDYATDLELASDGTILVGDWRGHAVKMFRLRSDAE